MTQIELSRRTTSFGIASKEKYGSVCNLFRWQRKVYEASMYGKQNIQMITLYVVKVREGK